LPAEVELRVCLQPLCGPSPASRLLAGARCYQALDASRQALVDLPDHLAPSQRLSPSDYRMEGG